MGDTMIKDVRSVFMANLGTAGKSQAIGGGDSFSQVFSKTQEAKSDSLQSGGQAGASSKSGVEEANKRPVLQNESKAKQLQEKTQEMVKNTEEETMKAACEEAGSMMVEKTAEAFGVTTEEVEAALEMLGLTALDLLNCDNLTKVALALNPGVDALTLMTDENLFTDLKSLMSTANELLNDLQKQFALSEEDMEGFLSSMKEAILEESSKLLQDTAAANDAVIDAEPAVQVDVEEDELLITKNGEHLTAEPVQDTSLEASAAMKTAPQEGRKEASQDESGNMAKQSFAQNLMNQLAEAVDEVQTAGTMYTSSGEEIINQITDYIKLHVKPQTTEIELQLHPASLGNVKVQIASTEGILTATFTTENESVKAALEAQLIQLKENFEQQGLKVESVEVNVAAKGFERSLDQESDGQRAFEENNKRSGRRIRLSGIDSLEDLDTEELAEEDLVVADMMKRNGNSVDYTV